MGRASTLLPMRYYAGRRGIVSVWIRSPGAVLRPAPGRLPPCCIGLIDLISGTTLSGFSSSVFTVISYAASCLLEQNEGLWGGWQRLRDHFSEPRRAAHGLELAGRVRITLRCRTKHLKCEHRRERR